MLRENAGPKRVGAGRWCVEPVSTNGERGGACPFGGGRMAVRPAVTVVAHAHPGVDAS